MYKARSILRRHNVIVCCHSECRIRSRFRAFGGTALTSAVPSDTYQHVEAFSKLLEHRDGSVVTDPHELEAYNTDWRGVYKGQSRIVLKPNTTQQVSAILQHCNSNQIRVVPQAGNTGLVGGSVPISNEVIVSVKNMNTIDSISQEGILQCDAGCILQELQTFAARHKYLVPIDLGAKGSCCIGGNISTNAGGQYYYRYGSLHANVLGLQVVLPDGRVLDTMQHGINLKDNTGYDLKHLFIGAEGTLGIITKVALQCPPLPQARNAVFVACRSYENVQETLELAKEMLGEVLAAFEYMDEAVLNLVSKAKSIPVYQNNGSSDNYAYCLIETHGSKNEHDMQKLDAFVEEAMTRQVVADGVVAQDLSQLQKMWEIRESCNPIVASQGQVYKYDLSIPISQFDDFVCEIRQRVQETNPEALVVNWGHVIDGNIHLNVTTPGVYEKDPELEARLEPFIFEAVMQRKGSISAEHGLGQCKNEYLNMCKDESTLQMMQSIKQLFDPNGIMNPGKFLPSG